MKVQLAVLLFMGHILTADATQATTSLVGDASCRPVAGGSGCFISNLVPEGPFPFDTETFQVRLADGQNIEILQSSFLIADLTAFAIHNSSSSSQAEINAFMSFTDNNEHVVGPSDGRSFGIAPQSGIAFLQLISTGFPVSDFIFHGINIQFECPNCVPGPGCSSTLGWTEPACSHSGAALAGAVVTLHLV